MTFSASRLLSKVVAICFFALDTTKVSAQECDPASGVCDKHERCSAWKDEGECIRNKQYMKTHCPVSCGFKPLVAKSSSSSDDDDNEETNQACEDKHERCHIWASLGECDGNPVDMHKYCAKSCNVCDRQEQVVEEQPKERCHDKEKRCSSWAKSGECKKNPTYMHFNCARSCGTCHKIADVAPPRNPEETGEISAAYARNLVDRSKKFGEEQKADGGERDAILHRIESTISYIASNQVAQLPVNIRRECKNRHELCTFWQVIGECTANQAYMQTNCAAACQSCEMIDHAQRCPPLPDAVPALIPGGLNQMFQRIVQTAPGNRTDLTDEERRSLQESGMSLFTVHVHSKPSDDPLTDVSVVQDKSLPPWVVTFENFLSDEECDALVQLGYSYGYKRSEDVGHKRFDGSFDSVQSAARTSENAWCSDREGCRSEEIPQRIHNRMAKVMEIPPENSEDLQILKYEVGQFYKTHHDYIPHQRDRQCGPRIMTFFLYLSDVEKGGGTNFPNLDLTIEPKKGRALLWPSVLDSDPSAKDSRMNHQALPVEAGTKFAANGWIHLYDYLGPQARGCS
ncbi:hypothetical protein ACA910_012835 [Epithemia clementina (nom. ined.)]